MQFFLYTILSGAFNFIYRAVLRETESREIN